MPHYNPITTNKEIERRWLFGDDKKLRIPTQKFYELYHRVMIFGSYIHQGYIKDPKLQKEALDIMIEASMPFPIPFNRDSPIDSMRIRRVLNNSTHEWSTEFTIKDGMKPINTELNIDLEQFGVIVIQKLWGLTHGHRIRKFRYERFEKGHKIIYDAFADRIMLVAEIEFDSVKAYKDSVKMPGKEVTFDSKYSNKNLGK